jgi:hypothetical protein
LGRCMRMVRIISRQMITSRVTRIGIRSHIRVPLQTEGGNL